MTDRNSYDELLSGHTIVKAELLHTRQIYPRMLGKNATRGAHGFGGTQELARITTDQGAQGFGLLSRPSSIGRKLHQEFFTEGLDDNDTTGLIGKNLAEIFSADTGILSEEYRTFDLPLHDLAGNILGIPVAKMINPDASEYAPAYDGAIYFTDLIPDEAPRGIEKVLEDCAYDLALGHNGLKIKIGRSFRWMEHDEGLKRDIEVVNRIHKAFPDAVLLVDANDGYTVQDTIDFLEGINNVPLFWIEEPFREEEQNLRRLKDYLKVRRPKTLLADGESMTDMELLKDLAEKGLLDVWQPDLCYLGLTEWRRLMKEFVPKGYLAAPHAWDCVMKTCYCAHLAAAYPDHVPYIETVIGYMEGIDLSGYQLKNGVFRIPDAPGFGMKLEYPIPENEPL